MLQSFIPQAQGLVRAPLAPGTPIPPEALWIDLIEPTPEEEKFVEQALGIDVPTREEMKEIEASNRLYEDNGTLYMTITIVTKLDTDLPVNSQITFILAGQRLITNRYVDPQPFQRFIAYAEKHPGTCTSAGALLAGLIEAIVNRMADVLERVGTDLDQLSDEVFSPPKRRRSASSRTRDSRAVLARVGQNGDLTSKARESLVTLGRLLAFVQQSSAIPPQSDVRARFRTLNRDVMALSDHATFLSGKATFLLEAVLGMLNIEQNNVIKIFSVAAVVLLPPTLIASIYGMNFRFMPEFEWAYGYPFAIALMVVSAILPYLYFKRRGWLAVAGTAAGCGRSAPRSSSATTTLTTMRNTGYSQPPPALLNTQPLPIWTHVAPIRMGTRASATYRVPMPSTSSAPPMASAAIVRYANVVGSPMEAKNCAVPAKP